jgi:Protein of unknown function (DUF3800)
MSSKTINIYCDESCHLEHDHIPVMALGAPVCPTDERRRITERIWELKAKHGLARSFEAKWTKVSPAKKAFYEELIALFFAEDALAFRAVVIPDKSLLDHERFGQNHDTFYYKMYYRLLTALLENSNRYHIYLDIKDTQGQKKVNKLHEVLCNAHLDFDRDMIERIQQMHSHEVELMQLTDLLIGALAYHFRNLAGSQAKLELIEQIKSLSGLSLNSSSLLSAHKFNLFVWDAQGTPNVAA